MKTFSAGMIALSAVLLIFVTEFVIDFRNHDKTGIHLGLILIALQAVAIVVQFKAEKRKKPKMTV